MEPTAPEVPIPVSVLPKRGPSSPKIIVDTNLTVQNSSAIRPTPVKAGKTITHLVDNNKQVQVSCLFITYAIIFSQNFVVCEIRVWNKKRIISFVQNYLNEEILV